jgi:hypothetical protein
MTKRKIEGLKTEGDVRNLLRALGDDQWLLFKRDVAVEGHPDWASWQDTTLDVSRKDEGNFRYRSPFLEPSGGIVSLEDAVAAALSVPSDHVYLVTRSDAGGPRAAETRAPANPPPPADN